MTKNTIQSINLRYTKYRKYQVDYLNSKYYILCIFQQNPKLCKASSFFPNVQKKILMKLKKM